MLIESRKVPPRGFYSMRYGDDKHSVHPAIRHRRRDDFDVEPSTGAKRSFNRHAARLVGGAAARRYGPVGARRGAGRGGPAFCAGHDLKEIRAENFAGAYTESLFAECTQVMLAIVTLPKPVIARVHGVATAAGCQLVASCDLAVAADDARFATPGVNIGLFCSTPMVALSRNVGRKAAMRMLLTGDLIDAETAIRCGLINEAAPAAELAVRTAALAAKIAAKSPLTLAIGKQAFYRQAELPLADAYAYAAAVMVANLAKRDAQEGIEAFIEKRSPVWCGQ